MKSRTNFPTERSGINYVRDIVESLNCRFIGIPQVSDFGVDAIIEVLYKNKTIGNQFAVQIKSGKSYCKKEYCIIKATKSHRDYWSSYRLPVFGIVYDPTEKKAYWINISEELEYMEKNIVKIIKSKTTQFTKKSFRDWITPESEKPKEILSLSKSIEYAKSKDPVNIHVGMSSLAEHYENREETWEIILDYFKNTAPSKIPDGIVYVLSAVPGHHGMFCYPRVSDIAIKNQVLERFSQFTKKDVIKLLYPINEYAEESSEYFPRGNTAHCAAVIISHIRNKNKILGSIIHDKRQNAKVRKYALLILAMYLQDDIAPILNDKSIHTPKLDSVIEYLSEWLSDKPRYELFSQW